MTLLNFPRTHKEKNNTLTLRRRRISIRSLAGCFEPATLEAVVFRSKNMSSVNGDKSRYHRVRKHKLAQRKKTRELIRKPSAPSSR